MKGRIFLVEWDASTARTLVSAIRAAGWDVEVESEDGGRAYTRVNEAPPDLLLIDISNKPSHGLRIAESLYQRNETRSIPIAFLGGMPSVRDKVRVSIPDAMFASLMELDGLLSRFSKSD